MCVYIYVYICIIAILAFLPNEPACANLQIVKFAHARERFLVLGIPGKSIICIYIHIIAFSLPTGGRKSAQTHNDSLKLL